MNLTDTEQRHGMRHAIIQACYGALSGVLVRDSSVIILFATMLGAGEALSLVTTSLTDLTVLLTLGLAYYTELVGKRRMIVWSSAVSMLAMLLCAAAPWCGTGSRWVLLGSLMIYAVFQSGYTAAWFPLLDGVVPANERGRFFGRMRVSWQLVSALFLFGAAWLVGRNASLPMLQGIILVSGLGMLGRIWHIRKMPEVSLPKPERFWPLVSDLMCNRSLVGFSVYLFFLYLAANATPPLIFLLAKNTLGQADNVVVGLSVVYMGGTILGYAVGGHLVDRYGVKLLFGLAHLSFGGLNLLLLVVTDGSLAFMLYGIVAAHGFVKAAASIAVSSEMLALAPENNKALSIAFCFSLYSAGNGLSRALASLILGSGLLASSWQLGGLMLTPYHSLFLFFGVMVILASVLMILVPALMRNVQRLPL